MKFAKWMAAMLAAVLLFTFVQPAGAEVLQVLLLGTDNLGESVTGEEDQGRADAIFLLSLHSDGGQIKVLSVERDYGVTLPDDLGPNKLGTSTYFGGPKMALDAVNELLGTNVRHYAQISLQNLVSLVDEIGGIDVEIHEDEVEPTNWFIRSIPPFNWPEVKAGVNTLTGNQAWAFMGNRDVEQPTTASNEGRNSRQMRTIIAGLDKLKSVGVQGTLDLYIRVSSFIETNLSMNDILALLEAALKSDLSNFEYLYSPAGAYQVKTVHMHRLVFPDDMDAEQQAVRNFLTH